MVNTKYKYTKKVSGCFLPQGGWCKLLNRAHNMVIVPSAHSHTNTLIDFCCPLFFEQTETCCVRKK